MGPTSVLSAIRHEEGSKGGERLADHLLIPGVDWIDQYRLNEMPVQGTYMRETEFVDRKTWEGMQMDGKRWFYFDRGEFIQLALILLFLRSITIGGQLGKGTDIQWSSQTGEHPQQTH
jgi:hypothetical protein